MNRWVGGLMHITVQTFYYLQYLIVCLSGYMNSSTQPDFISIKNCMEYLMHHTNEPIMDPRNKIYNTNESPHQWYFKSVDAEIKKKSGILQLPPQIL